MGRRGTGKCRALQYCRGIGKGALPAWLQGGEEISPPSDHRSDQEVLQDRWYSGEEYLDRCF